MKKLLKSKKALSPVVAAIILIAVTVAVSIAVAVWMGSLTTSFMETKELTITELDFSTADVINASVTNTGTTEVTIAVAKVNGASTTFSAQTDTSVPAGGSEYIEVDYPWQDGNKYKVDLFASDGTLMATYEATA